MRGSRGGTCVAILGRMDAAQTRVEQEPGQGVQVLVIGQRSLLGDLGPVLRALGIGIALGLGMMLLVNLLAQ